MIDLIPFDGYTFVSGGVCAPKGFQAAGIHCGIRKNQDKKDLALILSAAPCRAAAMYTQNKVQGAPIQICKKNLENHRAQAVLCNSGNANTCNADGEEKAQAMCKLAGKALGLKSEDVLVASTGVIGQILPLEPIEEHMDELVKALSPSGAHDAAEAIMTTDTVSKEVAVQFEIGGKTCTIAGMAKGSGMIHPNMATMLCFLTSDVSIDPLLLERALKLVVDDTFNMVSVDGDTSTNDTCALLCNGMAGNPEILDGTGEDYQTFVDGLYAVLMNLSRMLAADGEGATKLMECVVTGAADVKNAKIIAKGVITSTLFKCAVFGEDANWGRILCAIGYSPAKLDIHKVGVRLVSKAGSVEVCKNGAGVDFSEEEAAKVLHEQEVRVLVALGDGDGCATAWGCDLSYDYVKINGDYRT